MIPLGCVTGRFQPVHGQHLSLFGIALERCRHLVIAITNPDSATRHAEPTSVHRHTEEANPFSYFERSRLIEAAVRERGWASRCTLVPFDLTRPDLWPQYVPTHALQFVRAYGDWEREKAGRLQRAGYEMVLLDGDLHTKQSASEIRGALRCGDPRWRELVPPATLALLEQLQRQRAEEPRA